MREEAGAEDPRLSSAWMRCLLWCGVSVCLLACVGVSLSMYVALLVLLL